MTPPDEGTGQPRPAVIPAESPTSVQAATVLPAVNLKPDIDPAERFRKGISEAPGAVSNAEPGFQYTYILPGDFPDGASLTSHRVRLVDEGFEPVKGGLHTGPVRREFVPGHGAAEIWRRPKRYQDAEFLARMADTVLNPLWAAYYKRHPSGLPEVVMTAMYAHHGLMPLPADKRPPTRDELIDIVWKHLPVHPGGTKQNRFAW